MRRRSWSCIWVCFLLHLYSPTHQKDIINSLFPTARERFWNLSNDWADLSHQFLTLRNGFKFHFVCNDKPNSGPNSKPLVIFIHGFPDSWAIWRHIIRSSAIQSAATVVAIDLPGYGGSDSLGKYSATNVLEKLTEFVVTIRALYGIDGEGEAEQRRVVIVGHDWGCVLAMRLAAEAPQLADRFILSNGPLVSLSYQLVLVGDWLAN